MTERGSEKPTTYLITGITGSLGSSLAKALLADPMTERVIGVSRNDHRQLALEKEINDPRLECWLKDVTHREDMMWALRAKPDVVIHTAATKTIEKCQSNPSFAFRVNTEGVRHVVEEAMLADVPKVLVVSSDKAVEAVPRYGVTKAAAESIAIGQNALRGKGRTAISVVRYGTVEFSAGSVWQVFEEKGKRGEPIPITHEDMTRFLWPMERAVEFVLSVLGQMCGGEIFVPKLKGFSVLERARALAPNSPVEIIGLRRAEKLHEAMVSADESFVWELPDRYVVIPDYGEWWSATPPAEAARVPPQFRYSSDMVTNGA
jgi:UDP-N-acetylglucosamine 4,6-dehydratase